MNNSNWLNYHNFQSSLQMDAAINYLIELLNEMNVRSVTYNELLSKFSIHEFVICCIDCV